MALTDSLPGRACGAGFVVVSTRVLSGSWGVRRRADDQPLVLGVGDGVLHLTSVPAALLSQVGGAFVSYGLSRWAWERKGKPDCCRDDPVWIVFAVATVISTLATKLGYRMAAWSHLHGFERVLIVEVVYLAANVATFLMRFVIFHYVLFADRTAHAKKRPPGQTSWRRAPTRTAMPRRRSLKRRSLKRPEPEVAESPAADVTATAAAAT